MLIISNLLQMEHQRFARSSSESGSNEVSVSSVLCSKTAHECYCEMSSTVLCCMFDKIITDFLVGHVLSKYTTAAPAHSCPPSTDHHNYCCNYYSCNYSCHHCCSIKTIWIVTMSQLVRENYFCIYFLHQRCFWSVCHVSLIINNYWGFSLFRFQQCCFNQSTSTLNTFCHPNMWINSR